MHLLGLDLGGTKLATAVFDTAGKMLCSEMEELSERSGEAVGEMICRQIEKYLANKDYSITAIGISVPGISDAHTKTIWAPNIPGWVAYPLYDRIQSIAGKIPIKIESDRACYVLGEMWQGNAKGCTDVIYLAVGTGIGAGIFCNGKVLHGAGGIAGAAGWMALRPEFREEYISCGCFEHQASGTGMVKITRELLSISTRGVSELEKKADFNAKNIFEAASHQDPIAEKVLDQSIRYWGMSVANLISLFNPQKIIFGGGIFGPATALIPVIQKEAAKWAQPISMQQVMLEPSALGSDAGLYGAAYTALVTTDDFKPNSNV